MDSPAEIQDVLKDSLARVDYISDPNGSINVVNFVITDNFYQIDPIPTDENYTLLVEQFEITITSKNAIGAINALTTLNQLI